VDKENSNRSLWISDGLRRPRSLSLSSLVSPSLPSSWFCSRDATCDAPPQRSSSRWVFYPLNQPAKSAAPVAPPSKRRLLQLPHLLLDVPNPSFLQLQMTWSSSCGRGRVSQVTGAEQLGGGGGGCRGRARRRDAGSSSYARPRSPPPCRCAPPRLQELRRQPQLPHPSGEPATRGGDVASPSSSTDGYRSPLPLCSQQRLRR
jgi:hypothetical protein